MFLNSRMSRLFSYLVAATALLSLISLPGLAQDHDDDDIGPNQPGSEEMLNTQIWEYMKHSAYGDAKAYLANLHKIQRAATDTEFVLPTGWKFSPAGKQVEVGRLPYEAVTYNGKLVVLNNGYYVSGREDPEISVVDPATATVSSTFRLPSLFPSAVASSDGDLYISGGISKQVFRVNSNFERVQSYPIDGFVGGITEVDSTHLAVSLLVTADSAANFAKGIYGAGKIVLLNTSTGVMEATGDSGNFPFAIVKCGNKLYASILGDDKVEVLDAATMKPIRFISVGKKPQTMTVTGDKVYVVNSGSDTISEIDSRTDSVETEYSVRLNKTDFGCAVVSCAIDVEHNRLYAALANTNMVSVIDLADGKRIGAIPTGWYPTKVMLDPTSMQLFVLNGKGIRSRRPNPNGPQAIPSKSGPDYVLTLLRGSAEIIPVADVSSNLAAWTKTADSSNPSVMANKSKQQIKHIFYIVRENRTYDQIMGDIPGANGDINLNLFGKDYTPNGHSIAQSFVTLDNYFADGEISVLGHSFTTSGYASPFLEWLANANYSGRFGGYPFGMVPAATSPAYLWDAMDKRGLDYRIYGENYFLYTRAFDILKQSLGENSEAVRKFYAKMMKLSSDVDRGAAFYKFALPYYGKADTIADADKLLDDTTFLSEFSRFLCGDETLTVLLPLHDEIRAKFAAYLVHYPFNYRSWDLKFSDLDRAKVWKADFEKQLKSGKVAALHYLWLPNDHTGGTNKAYLPPDQLVSQNDAALGYIFETISHSSIWKNSLILVTEDDAQNGPDHVDATRTVALAAGPNVKRGAVISDRFDQLSLLRTMGLILGFSPLNHNDAMASPMFSIFASKPDNKPYTMITPTHMADEDADRLKKLKN